MSPTYRARAPYRALHTVYVSTARPPIPLLTKTDYSPKCAVPHAHPPHRPKPPGMGGHRLCDGPRLGQPGSEWGMSGCLYAYHDLPSAPDGVLESGLVWIQKTHTALSGARASLQQG